MYTFYVFPNFVDEGEPVGEWGALRDSKYKSVMRFGWTKNHQKLFPESWYPILVKDLPHKVDAMLVERRFKFALMLAQTFGEDDFIYVAGSTKLVASDLSIRDLHVWLRKVDKKIRSHPVGLGGSHRLS